jgi:hypothetical protein
MLLVAILQRKSSSIIDVVQSLSGVSILALILRTITTCLYLGPRPTDALGGLEATCRKMVRCANAIIHCQRVQRTRVPRSDDSAALRSTARGLVSLSYSRS